ncbi:hypothetical protein D3C73_1012090 [compost metagenome]
MAEDAELAAVAADQDDGGGKSDQRDDADHAHRCGIQRQRKRGRGRLHAQRHTDQQPCAEDEAQRAHQHHLADLRQVQAGTAVAAQAHGTTGECGKAHGLAQRVGQERGDADPCRVHADAAAAQADCIEADQARVAGQAEQHGERDLGTAELAEGLTDRAIAVLIEFTGQPVQGQRQDQQWNDDGDDPLPGRGSGGRDGIGRGGHRRKGASVRARAVSTQGVAHRAPASAV